MSDYCLQKSCYNRTRNETKYCDRCQKKAGKIASMINENPDNIEIINDCIYNLIKHMKSIPHDKSKVSQNGVKNIKQSIKELVKYAQEIPIEEGDDMTYVFPDIAYTIDQKFGNKETRKITMTPYITLTEAKHNQKPNDLPSDGRYDRWDSYSISETIQGEKNGSLTVTENDVTKWH